MEGVICSSFSEKHLLKIIYKAWLLKWLLVSFSGRDKAWLMLFSYQNTDLTGEGDVMRAWQVLWERCSAPLP